jgi:hypothetical protein
MSTKPNWDLAVNWVGDSHILLTMERADDSDTKNETLLTVKEYAEFMQLLQEFNLQFRDRIDQQLINSYLNG